MPRITTFSGNAWWKQNDRVGIPLDANSAVCDLLESGSLTILAASRQSSKLCAISAREGRCFLYTTPVSAPMGLAISGSAIAVGTAAGLLVFRAVELNQDLSCWLPVAFHRTGNVSIHECAWAGSELVFLNTLFSAVCTTGIDCNFEILWRPEFIKEDGPLDHCHANGMASEEGGRTLVTALAATGSREGWRMKGIDEGVLIDTEAGVVMEGLSVPHSPVVRGDRVWFLESATGHLVSAQMGAWRAERHLDVRGFCRGLHITDTHAFIGLSKIREGSATSEVLRGRFPTTEACTIAVVGKDPWHEIGRIDVPGIEEISSLLLIPSKLVSFLDTNSIEANRTFVCKR